MPPDCIVLHMGEHQLKDLEGATALYLAQPKPLAARLALLPPLRTLGLTSPSILQAPVGQAVVVFMHAVGIKALRAWSAELTKDTLQIYHEVGVCFTRKGTGAGGVARKEVGAGRVARKGPGAGIGR